MNSLFKDLGVGVGLRPTHHSQFIAQKPKTVSWVEVISENFMPWRGQSFGQSIVTLEKVRQDLPVALHGVSMNLGSSDPLDLEYMARLKELVDRIDPILVSDHMAWTGVDGYNTHDLLPIPYTEEALENIAQKMDQAQKFLGRRILIENPSSYFEFQSSEMSEPEFIANLLKIADCGLLLDVNNVFVSSKNHGFDPIDYLRKIPMERVGQIHVAGHTEVDGQWIDTHDTPVCDEVWRLLDWTFQQIGSRSVMLERDGHIPEWSELEREVVKIGALYGAAKTKSA